MKTIMWKQSQQQCLKMNSLQSQHGKDFELGGLINQNYTALVTAVQQLYLFVVHCLTSRRACFLSGPNFCWHLPVPEIKNEINSLCNESNKLATMFTFSSFLSPFSSEVTASLSALTTSAGDFCDFPNRGILIPIRWEKAAISNTGDRPPDTAITRKSWKESRKLWGTVLITSPRLFTSQKC